MQSSHTTTGAGPGTVRTGLIGSGIGPSLSPALHEREAAAAGLALRYERWDLDVLRAAPTDVGDLLGAARSRGYAGVNVTHPCKQLVIPHLDALSPDAAAVGSSMISNTVSPASFPASAVAWR